MLSKTFFRLNAVNNCAEKSLHLSNCVRNMSTTQTLQQSNRHYKLVVVGGGSGGCSISAKFAKKIPAAQIAVVEPTQTHYYQPMWTLVGGGMKTLEDSGKPMSSVLPKGIQWFHNKVVNFQPKENQLEIDNGEKITYDFLVVALGIQLNYSQIKGLPDAFETPGVGSNYSPLYVNKTFEALKNFQKGNAIFTFPNTPIKCAGAPQKILYISDSYLRKHKKRKNAKLIYNTSLGVIFAVKHYADALWEVVKKRDIEVNTRRNLIEVSTKHKTAVFEDLDKPGKTETLEYEMLHVTPPMGAYEVMKNAPKEFSDASGYLSVNKETLQHTSFSNVFGIGDCTNAPTSKTAAAVAAQVGVVESNLWPLMNGKEVGNRVYDGYTSCPLVTSYSTCILAEFDYNGQPLETFPINQAKERRTMFYMKKDIMPYIYWNLMLKGHWNGPGIFRKMMHLGMK